MRIGIDAHAIGTGAGGNETYIRSLIAALRAPAPEFDFTALALRDVIGRDPDCVMGMPTFPLRLHSSILRTPFELPWAAWRLDLDLIHVQYNAPPLCPCPFVVSLHDVGWERHPDLFTPGMRRRLALLVPGTLRRAARVFALTHAIKHEIHETYGTALDRIDVVSPGVDPAFFERHSPESITSARSEYRIPNDYVLYVGALQPRKNLVRLAAAFKRVVDRHPSLPHALVLAGKKTWLYDEVIDSIESLRLGDRLIFTGYVAQEHLISLVQGASVFAYISLYEGFGLPVLEAMAAGTPVLTSSTRALREVAGDAAVICEPLDDVSIEAGLEQILLDAPLRAQLQALGTQRASHYSLQAMARSAIAGYQSALS
ncbi:MAG: glycosyl transferase [Candidatus Hydrogenedentota bacterium]